MFLCDIDCVTGAQNIIITALASINWSSPLRAKEALYTEYPARCKDTEPVDRKLGCLCAVCTVMQPTNVSDEDDEIPRERSAQQCSDLSLIQSEARGIVVAFFTSARLHLSWGLVLKTSGKADRISSKVLLQNPRNWCLGNRSSNTSIEVGFVRLSVKWKQDSQALAQICLEWKVGMRIWNK